MKMLKTGIGGNRGVIEVQNQKYRLLHYLLHTDLDSHALDATAKAKVRECLRDAPSYRKHVLPLDGSETDLTWKAAMPPAQRELVALYEAC